MPPENEPIKNFTIDIPVVYSVHWHHSVALLLHCQASYKQTNKQKKSNFIAGMVYIIIEKQNQTL